MVVLRTVAYWRQLSSNRTEAETQLIGDDMEPPPKAQVAFSDQPRIAGALVDP